MPEEQKPLRPGEGGVELKSWQKRQWVSNPSEWWEDEQRQQDTMAQAGAVGEEIRNQQLDERNLPVDWDYKTSSTGAWGEPLPEGSQGWLPNNRPDFGEGPAAWWKEQVYKFDRMFHDRETEEESRQLSGYYEDVKPPEKDKLKFYFGRAVTGLNYYWRRAERAEQSPTALQVVSGLIGTAGDAAMRGLQQFARGVERVITPSLLTGDEYIRDVFEKNQSQFWLAEAAYDWINENIPIIRTGVKLVFSVPTWFSPEYREQREEYQEAQIWRMGYSAAYDGMAREEFMRRVNAGEDPRLLAMELENPVAELFGQLAFDPLNHLGRIKQVLGIPTRADKLRAAGRAQHIEIVPEMAKVSDDLGRAMVSNSDEVAKAGKGVLSTLAKVVDDSKNALHELGGKRGIRVLTDDGKRFVVGRHVSDHLSMVASGQKIGGNIDKVGDYVKAMALLGGGNADEATEALRILGELGMPIERTFSPAGIETMVMMRNLLVDEAGNWRSIKNLLGDIAESGFDVSKIAEKIDGRLADSLKKIFPTLPEQIVQHDEYLKLLKESPEKAAEFLAKFPHAEREISKLSRAASATNSILQKWFYKPVAAIQGVVYMGLSPAYWLRNRFSNMMHVFVDQGLEAGIRSFRTIWSPATSTDELTKMLGYLPHSARMGFGPAGAVGDFKPKFGFSGKAAADEAAMSAHIMATSVRDTMTKGIAAALDDVHDVLQVLPEETRNILTKIAKRHNGNADEILSAVLNSHVEGGYDAARNLLFLTDEDIAGLTKSKLYEPFLEAALESKTVDEAIGKIDDLMRSQRNAGRGAAAEASTFDANGLSKVGQTHVEDAAEYMAGSGKVTQTASDNADLIGRKALINHHSISQRNEALAELQREVTKVVNARVAEDVASGAKTQQEATEWASQKVDEILNFTRGPIDEIDNATVAEARAFTSRTKGLSDASKMRDSNLFELWDKAGFGPVPDELKNISREEFARAFRNRLWDGPTDGYRIQQDIRWTQRREDIYTLQQTQLETLAEELYGADWESLLASRGTMQNANQSTKLARLHDRVQMINGKAYAVWENTADDFVELIEDVTNLKVNRTEGRVLQEGGAEGAASVRGTFNNKTKRWDLAVDQNGNLLLTISDELLEEATGNPRIFVDSIAHELAHGIESAMPQPLFDEMIELFPYSTIEGAAMKESPFADTFSRFVRLRESDTAAIAIRKKLKIDKNQYNFLQRLMSNDMLDNVFIGQIRDLSALEKTKDGFRLLTPNVMDDLVPSGARMAHETAEGVGQLTNKVKQGLYDNWGQLHNMTLEPQQMSELRQYLDGFKQKMDVVKSEAVATANEMRDFALHAYPERYGYDLALGYVYPYQFWHNRTYQKWMKRLTDNPAILAKYGQYRSFLEKQNAGLPDWWKYQINTNQMFGFLGVDSKNPLFFNLESTLNPLYGITNTDFSDPKRRLDWWSSTMEDLNKFGPTVWTPYQLALATRYHMQGQDEAAAKWAGRVFTGTRAFRDITALLGFNEGTGIEIDPFINFFSGGIGPYEEPRVGRILSAFQRDGKYPEADIIDAAYNRDGPIWTDAVATMIGERAPGQIASFFLGTGFKPRSETDIQIDRLYAEMNGLYAQREFMPPDAYQQAWDQLRTRYPFMDTLLLSRKGDAERDEALAWNVLGRIPPGMSDEFAEMVNVSYDTISQFYEDKGNIEGWKEADRMDFMAGILNMSAMLELPDGATRAEWDLTRDLYKQMMSSIESAFGEDIHDEIDRFYNAENKDAFLRQYPHVEQAMDMRQELLIADPRLSAYYMGAEKIEKYLKSEMYEEAEKLYGKDLWDHFEVHSQLGEVSKSASRRYWREHPQLGQYMDFKEANLPLIAERVAELGALIPEIAPPVFREGMEPPEELMEGDTDAWIRAQVMSYLAGAGDVTEPSPSVPQLALQDILGEEGYRLFLDNVYLGMDMPKALEDKLKELGIEY